jgi:hypothetical protein
MQAATRWEMPNHAAVIASGHAIAGTGTPRNAHASAKQITPTTARATRCRCVIECEGPASSPIVHSEQYVIFIGDNLPRSRCTALITSPNKTKLTGPPPPTIAK